MVDTTISVPFLYRGVQSGQRSCSWFQDMSQFFPGVTPQLLQRMHTMHTYTQSRVVRPQDSFHSWITPFKHKPKVNKSAHLCFYRFWNYYLIGRG